MKTRTKTVVSLLIFFISYTLSAQKIQYGYDASGNRIQRKLVVSCPTCPNNGREAAPSVTDNISPVIKYNLALFPNPTQDKVILTCSNLAEGETASVLVTDENGKTLYTQQNIQAQSEINMSSYNNGMYLVRVSIGKEVQVYKVMKIQ